ncbi:MULTISPECIES: hypothetical protein [unclassified Thomasclavelia]|uniref:MurR/RpiR family transcriptional regulator n=1 Tax=unclassified Thomasclavelia TaxID=3025756 RepID=UPI0025F954DE|nr:hypothetical protein [Thomasclavelia sp.]
MDLSSILFAVIEKEEPGSTNYIIADYIIKNSQDLDNISTVELAKACNVSKASISRFCRKIGLEDFLALKILIRSYKPGKTVSQKYSFKQTTDDDVINFIDESIDKMTLLKKHLDRTLLNEITQDINKYQRVYLMGLQQSAGIMISLANDLMTFKKYAFAIMEPKKINQILKNATDQDLIIVFSATGSFFEKILPRKNIINKNNPPRIYLITTIKTDIYSFVYKNIFLDDEYNFSSNLLLNIYASLIAINFKNLYQKSLTNI